MLYNKNRLSCFRNLKTGNIVPLILIYVKLRACSNAAIDAGAVDTWHETRERSLIRQVYRKTVDIVHTASRQAGMNYGLFRFTHRESHGLEKPLLIVENMVNRSSQDRSAQFLPEWVS